MKSQKTNEKDDLISQLIDLDAFPINQPASSAYFALVEQARASLDLDGCVRFGQFIKPWENPGDSIPIYRYSVFGLPF